MHGVSCMEIDIGTMNEVMRLVLEFIRRMDFGFTIVEILGELMSTFVG